MASNPRDRASKELVEFVTERVNAGANYSWRGWHKLTKEAGFTESYPVVKDVAFQAIHQVMKAWADQRQKQLRNNMAARLERIFGTH